MGGTQLGNEQLTLKLVLKWIQIAQGYQLILVQIVILVIDAVTKKIIKQTMNNLNKLQYLYICLVLPFQHSSTSDSVHPFSTSKKTMLVKRIEMNELSSTSINESMIEQQIFSVLSLWYAAKTHLTKLK